MKAHYFALVTSLAAFCFLPSCASKFSASQRAALSTVAIAGTTVNPEAYEEPYAGDIAARNRMAQNASNAGALGYLVASGLGSAMTGVQNANFKGDNRSYFNAVQKNTPTDLGKVLNSKIKDSVKADNFFRNRVTNSSPNLVTSEITSYRLLRAGENDEGHMTFTPEIYTEIHLKDASGKTLVGGTYIGTTTQTLSIYEYAGSAAKSKQAYDAALKTAVRSFSENLAEKTQD